MLEKKNDRLVDSLDSSDDAEEFNTLQKTGLELGAPQDEYTYQPDSGSAIDGERGKLEYGIDSEFTLEKRNPESLVDQDLHNPVPGESQWSQEHRLPEEVPEPSPLFLLSDEQLLTLIYDRLGHHPKLKLLPLAVVVREGQVSVKGVVSYESQKMEIEELIEALPSVTALHSHVVVQDVAQLTR